MAEQPERKHAIFKVKAEGKTRLVVFDTQDLSLGRAPENDLAIDDIEMSRKHALFVREAQETRVRDLGTSNGTEVNGTTVPEAALQHGDTIRIGEVEITYAETARNPATLGTALEYASQLKGFSNPMAGGDGEATMLGLGGGGEGEDLDIRPAGDFEYDLHDMSAPGDAPRDLDADLASLGDSLEFDGPAAQPAADEVWDLDDDVPAKPAPTGTTTLTLEIDGLDGDLRRVVEGLAGKVLSLPQLRIRIKSDDLD
ncbi:MAG: FHA domain-containing protein [Myxococcota bacterium]